VKHQTASPTQSPERGVHAASTYERTPTNRITPTPRTLKRPEGRAPLTRCAQTHRQPSSTLNLCPPSVCTNRPLGQTKTRQPFPPLLGGEGRGEGEQPTNFPPPTMNHLINPPSERGVHAASTCERTLANRINTAVHPHPGQNHRKKAARMKGFSFWERLVIVLAWVH